jgi:hypothetical protein
MNEVAEKGETPAKTELVPLRGAGVGWMDQAEPFHASASVAPTPEELMYSPTAAQAVAERHAKQKRS